jgi:catechol 2,3-dioxygenase-like lactoylglutathione lyase family enzyme
MKTNGLDRVEVLVNDFDKAFNFFSNILGVKGNLLEPAISEKDRMRTAVFQDIHLHIISPILPLSDDAPPPFKKTASLLQGKEMVFAGISFLFDDDSKRKSQDADGVIKGLDRIIIMVNDIDKAVNLFSGRYGMQFKELDKEVSERDGLRSYVCHETHLHLVAPVLNKLSSVTPSMKKKLDLLKTNEFVFLALTFMVDNPVKIGEELENKGVRMQKFRYVKSHDYASIGMDNFEEVMTVEEDTFGIVIGFANYTS